MILSVNIAELLKALATNCSEGLAWILGIVGTIGTGTIIGAIIAIVKSKIQSKTLVENVNSTNQANYDKLMQKIEEFETKINNSNKETVEGVASYGKDNSIVAELLLMLASKMGFSNDEIIKVANKYKELPKADNNVANSIVASVNQNNDAALEKENMIKEETQKNVEKINASLNKIIEEQPKESFKISLWEVISYEKIL